jgi:hypothetical protein
VVAGPAVASPDGRDDPGAGGDGAGGGIPTGCGVDQSWGSAAEAPPGVFVVLPGGADAVVCPLVGSVAEQRPTALALVNQWVHDTSAVWIHDERDLLFVVPVEVTRTPGLGLAPAVVGKERASTLPVEAAQIGEWTVAQVLARWVLAEPVDAVGSALAEPGLTTDELEAVLVAAPPPVVADAVGRVRLSDAQREALARVRPRRG